MTEEILKTEIKKEKGMLYFCRESPDGFITVNKSRAGRPTGWRKDKTKMKGIVSPDMNGMNGHTALTEDEINKLAVQSEDMIAGAIA